MGRSRRRSTRMAREATPVRMIGNRLPLPSGPWLMTMEPWTPCFVQALRKASSNWLGFSQSLHWQGQKEALASHTQCQKARPQPEPLPAQLESDSPKHNKSAQPQPLSLNRSQIHQLAPPPATARTAKMMRTIRKTKRMVMTMEANLAVSTLSHPNSGEGGGTSA